MDTTTLVEGGGDHEAVQDRVAQIRREMEGTDSDWDREKLGERLAKLSGGVCVIKVGAATEVEMKGASTVSRTRCPATRAALEEGIVPGGGSALVQAAKALDGLDLPGDEGVGVQVVRRSLASRCVGSPRTPVNPALWWCTRWPRVVGAGTHRPASTATRSPTGSSIRSR